MFGVLIILRISFLVGRVKLLLVTEGPVACAVVHRVLRTGFGSMMGEAFRHVMIAAPVVVGLAWLYFWLLNRFQGTDVFWAVRVCGRLPGIV